MVMLGSPLRAWPSAELCGADQFIPDEVLWSALPDALAEGCGGRDGAQGRLAERSAKLIDLNQRKVRLLVILGYRAKALRKVTSEVLRLSASKRPV
jgi:hypothetical protein